MTYNPANNEELPYLQELIQGKPIPRFGTLMRQVLDGIGVNQVLFEKRAQAKYDAFMFEKYGKQAYERMKEDGTIPKEEQSSMLQQVISRVINGLQRPSYIQMLIWMGVIADLYNNESIKKWFRDNDLEMPVFSEEIEEALWALSGHQCPRKVNKVIADFSAFSNVPRRLPKDVKTDANLQSMPHRKNPDTDALAVRDVREFH